MYKDINDINSEVNKAITGTIMMDCGEKKTDCKRIR